MTWKERGSFRSLTLSLLAAVVILLVATIYLYPGQSGSHPSAAQFPTTRNGTDRARDFAVLDHEGKHHQLYRYVNSRAVVLFVYGSDCPIARNTIPALKELRDEFADRGNGFMMKSQELYGRRSDEFLENVGLALARRSYRLLASLRERYASAGVSFLLIDSSPQDDRKTLRQDAVRYGIDMPILKDDTQLVAESLDLDRTGEALLIDTRTWQVVYRGPVDDRLDYEVVKPQAKQHFLRDAIEALLDGRAVDRAPPAIGCRVSLKDEKKDISYAQHVAPILTAKCVSCHQAGGIGPWAMDSYDKVKGWSAMMREVLMNRRMPPWHADPAIGTFSNDRSLNGEQIRTLVHWIDAGAPRGEGPDPLVERKVEIVPEWPLGKPDLVIDVPEQQIPASGAVDYRYIDIPVPVDRDVWVRAADLRPSNRAVMHHAVAFINDRPALDNNFLAAFGPGLQDEPFPENSGRLLPKGTVVLKFELHYQAVGYATSDRPRLALYLHKRPPSRELVVTDVWAREFLIPPYTAAYPIEVKFVFDRDALLHAFLPHMHYRGSTASYEARYPDGRREILLSVPRFNFNWQTLYTLRTPKPIPAKTEIVVKGVFDNSSSNPANPDPSRAVPRGLKSWDEMLDGYIVYTVPRQSGSD